MFLSISTFLLAPNLVFSHFLSQSYSLALSALVWQFELDDIFRDSHIIVSCILCYHQVQIQALFLTDSRASGYAFIDQNFTYKHLFPLYKLKYLRRLFEFNG